MYSASTLSEEIEEILLGRIENGECINKGWLVHEILLRHPLPSDLPDRDFTECCRKLAVADAVNKVNRRFKEDPGTVAQGSLPLPGFVYLQRAYSVERDGDNIIVPLSRLTAAEAAAKVALYRQFARGCDGHADELERYFADRASVA